MNHTPLHVWPEPIRRHEGDILFQGVVERVPGRRDSLWFRMDEACEPMVMESGDPFASCLIYLAMKDRRDLHIHGQVSPSLICNLSEYQKVWAAWMPEVFHPVDIRADIESEQVIERPDRQAICTFSGGVDSAFTAFYHVRGADARLSKPLKTALMIQGFDIPLDDPVIFENATHRSSRMTDSLGLDLITLRTNFRYLETDWSKSYGSALAACLMLFKKRFSEGLIAQGMSYHHLNYLSVGSNPLSDPMLSSASFQVVPDGAGYLRTDKISIMKDWPEMRKYIRVCWQGEAKDRNCCICEKCIRNILSFRVLGLGLPECFDRDVDDRRIRNLAPLKDIKIHCYYESILHLANQRGIRDPWVDALQTAIRRNRRRTWRRMKSYARTMKSYLSSPAKIIDRLKSKEPS